MDDGDILKVRVHVPLGSEDAIMDAVDAVMEPVYPGYERVFSVCRATGTWRPVEGSHPFKGETGRIEVADESILEFAVRGRDVRAAVSAIAVAHPYEEPAIDIIPMIGWKELIL
jgi:hypothetical protein